MLKDGILDLKWRPEDVARTTLRLALVLLQQNRRIESKKLREEAVSLLSKSIHEKRSDQELMECIDSLICLYNGRTSGFWSDGKHW